MEQDQYLIRMFITGVNPLDSATSLRSESKTDRTV